MLNGFALPRHFGVEKEGEKIFIFKEGYGDIVRGAEFRNPQSAIPNLRTVRGRGEYPRIPLEGGGTAIIRRVRHGGLWGKVAGDLLWGVGRPVRELINANKALERGVPTAEILGIRLEAAGPPLSGPFYRAEVFSRELPETIDLLELLESSESTLDVQQHRGEIIRAVALSVRAMHEAGLYHNDLHLKNILITREAPFKAYIIDLDKSSLHESLSLNQKIKNLLRLDRSVEKFMTVGAYRNTPLRPITQRDRLRFLRDYMGGSRTWKEMARGWQGHSRHPGHAFHRWWWWVLGVMGIDPYGLRRNLL
ncbi:MAG: lipopolysaccharide kinase InaA family protein [Candidatus Brocadiaceae bacterium]|nr:lipopolysaccharide kinase InaA family protein [Candidatus Brocadiaceae bacterium]